jgi:hypothetical protein
MAAGVVAAAGGKVAAAGITRSLNVGLSSRRLCMAETKKQFRIAQTVLILKVDREQKNPEHGSNDPCSGLPWNQGRARQLPTATGSGATSPHSSS